MRRADRKRPAATARPERHRGLAALRRAVVVAAVVLVAAAQASASPEGSAGPKRVFILDSYGREFSPYSDLSSLVRTNLGQRAGHTVEFFHVALQTHGFETRDEAAVADYVGAICSRRPPDLVVTIGGPAVLFFTAHRDRFGAGVPVVHGGPDQRWLKGILLTPQETAVVVRMDIPALMENILRVRPQTKEVVVVFGDSPAERFWADHFRREWQPWASRVRLTLVDALPFDEIVRRSEHLPPDAVIFFGLMIIDAAGVPYEQQSALERLHRVASAPIFGWASVSLGHGILGGPLHPVETLAEETAAVGVKLLHGVPASSIPVKTITLSSPVYDARELKRWRVDERTLPAGSEIRFHGPSFFSLYRGWILGAAAVVLVQAFAIAALVVGRRRQRRAEQEAVRLRDELAHAGRVSVMGQLATSLAHELAQPLGAMLRNAEAAELFLSSEAPDLDELRAIVADIKADDQRARGVLERMRDFLRRRHVHDVPLDADALVEGVLSLVRPDAREHGVRLEVNAARELPPVAGDPIHLQQVLLNLFMNAIDAMDASPAEARVRAAEGPRLEIAVADTGPGISAEALPKLFETFYTTKKEGMGMGLPISRSLVESHGGTLRVETACPRGATFVLSLPAGEKRA